MNLPDLTASIVVAVTVALIGYDVWVKHRQPDGGATISWVVLTSSKRWPVIAFAFGFLMGHLFFQNCAVP